MLRIYQHMTYVRECRMGDCLSPEFGVGRPLVIILCLDLTINLFTVCPVGYVIVVFVSVGLL